MQATKFRELVLKASENSGIEESVLQSMSDFVFRDVIKKEMGQFNNLFIHLRGWWTWFYKYKGRSGLVELDRKIGVYQDILDGNREKIFMKYRSFLGAMNGEELIEMKHRVSFLLGLYEQYVREKKQLREDNNKQNYESDNLKTPD